MQLADERGMPQSQVADIVGYSRETVNRTVRRSRETGEVAALIERPPSPPTATTTSPTAVAQQLMVCKRRSASILSLSTREEVLSSLSSPVSLLCHSNSLGVLDRRHRASEAVSRVSRPPSPLHSMTAVWVLCLCAALCVIPSPVASISYSDVRGRPYRVDYDHRSLRINGERVLLQSAGIHYPRSSPSMWPQLMASSAAAHLNTVQTYVFHNYHEVVRGEWDWTTEHRNLSGFLQAAADAGLFVNLRIGPYICGEWFYGGQPLWMHGTGIPFRQYNTEWTNYMRGMMTTVVQHVEPFLARNGGSETLALRQADPECTCLS